MTSSTFRHTSEIWASLLCSTLALAALPACDSAAPPAEEQSTETGADPGEDTESEPEPEPAPELDPALSLTLVDTQSPIQSPTRATLRAEPITPEEVSRVDFFVDGELLGSDEQAPFEATWLVNRGAQNGTRALTAVAHGEQGPLGDPGELSVEQALPAPGAQVWAYLDGLDNGNTVAFTDITALPDGRIAWTGRRGNYRLSMMLDAQGTPVWENTGFDGATRCVVVDGDELVFLGAGNEHHNVITRTDLAGQVLEVLPLADTPTSVYVRECAWHEGALSMAAEGSDGLLLFENLEQQGSWPQEPHLRIEAHDLAIDTQGRMTVVGEDNVQSGVNKSFAVQFDAEGQLLWEYTVPDVFLGGFRGVAIDPSNDDVVVVGTHNDFNESEGFVARLSAEGELLWEFPAPGDQLQDVVIDELGTIYMVARGYAQAGDQHGYRIYALNRSGELLWFKEFELDQVMIEMEIAIGPHGELFVGGEVSSPIELFVMQVGI